MKHICPASIALSAALLLLLSVASLPGSPVALAVAGLMTPASPPHVGPVVEIWPESHENLSPAVAYNAQHGEYLAVWYTKQDSFTWDIWARRIGSTGELRSSFNVMSAAGARLLAPAVAYSPQQQRYGVVAVRRWSDDDFDPVFTQFSWSGSSVSLTQLIDSDVRHQENPSLAYNSQLDQFLVVYENQREDGHYEVVARRIQADTGYMLGDARTVVAWGASDDYILPDVTYNPARNNYVVCYRYLPSSPANTDIRCKAVPADLSFLGPEFIAGGGGAGVHFPALAAGPDGHLVVWSVNPDGVTARIVARRIGWDGQPLGAAGGYTVSLAAGFSVIAVDAAYSPPDGYLVVWDARTTGLVEDSFDVFGSYVPANADPPPGAGLLVDGSVNRQDVPAVACGPNGGCLVVEEHNLQAWPQGNKDIRGVFVGLRAVFLPLILRP